MKRLLGEAGPPEGEDPLIRRTETLLADIASAKIEAEAISKVLKDQGKTAASTRMAAVVTLLDKADKAITVVDKMIVG